MLMLPLALSTVLLASCGDSKADKESKALIKRQEAESYAKENAARERMQVGEKDAIALSDKDLQSLIESCKSLVYTHANNESSDAIAMVESESAAQYVIAAGKLAMSPPDRRVAVVRFMQSKGPHVYINMHYAVVRGSTVGKVVTEYRCKLAPGPVLDGVEKVNQY